MVVHITHRTHDYYKSTGGTYSKCNKPRVPGTSRLILAPDRKGGGHQPEYTGTLLVRAQDQTGSDKNTGFVAYVLIVCGNSCTI